MIHSLFLVNASGDIFLEKHWKSVVSRSVCDYFFEALERATEPENVPPVIPTPHHYLISVLRHRIYFVAVIQSEVPPLFVIEFLHRVVDTFQVSTFLPFSVQIVLFQWHLCGCTYPITGLCCQDYFGVCTEAAIKDNVVVVYELLEEMLDNGFPLATESNILKELIKPPTILRTMVNTITGTVTWLWQGSLAEERYRELSFLCNLLVSICLLVFQAAPTLGNSCLLASCQWYPGDAPELNTLTMKPTLTLWRRSMQSSINQVILSARSSLRVQDSPTWVLLWCFNLQPSCSGSTITAEIQGVIDACVKLTGMPDLTLSFMVSFLFLHSRVCWHRICSFGDESFWGHLRFWSSYSPTQWSISQNPRLLDDVSFHPCVRFKRWEAERILSFIPPDGNFRLLSYHVSSQKLVL